MPARNAVEQADPSVRPTVRAAVANLAGGSGRSTLTWLLGVAAAEQGLAAMELLPSHDRARRGPSPYKSSKTYSSADEHHQSQSAWEGDFVVTDTSSLQDNADRQAIADAHVILVPTILHRPRGAVLTIEHFAEDPEMRYMGQPVIPVLFTPTPEAVGRRGRRLAAKAIAAAVDTFDCASAAVRVYPVHVIACDTTLTTDRSWPGLADATREGAHELLTTCRIQ